MKLIFIAALFSVTAHAELCNEWNTPVPMGSLDGRVMEETSGMVVSALPDTLYIHNDSGNDGGFFKAKLDGSNLQEVKVNGGSSTDTEDMSYGACPGKPSSRCLFLADIGDNLGWRGSLNIVVIEELAEMPREVRPLLNVKLKYPDGAHNAEAFAVHPNGDFYIVTKEEKRGSARPAMVYRFAAKDVATGSAKGTKLGELNVPKILNDSSNQAIVTGMSLSADGKKFMLLSYLDAIEFNMDLSALGAIQPELVAGKDYSVAALTKLEQQESIAYFPDGKQFVYSTELENKSTPDAPLLRVSCKE